MFTHEKRPSVLFHYTSADALLAILQTRTLRASDIRFLNDESEYRFACSLLLNDLRLRVGRLRDPAVRDKLYQRFDEIESEDIFAFVASFSENGNALSQWRAYAPRDGVAIGFSWAALNAIPGFKLQRCYYFSDEPKKVKTEKETLHALGDDIYEAVADVASAVRRRSSSRKTTDLDNYGDMYAIKRKLVRKAVAIKHSGFAEELEWRLIHDETDPSPERLSYERRRRRPKMTDDEKDVIDIGFRAGVFGITPYMTARLPKELRGQPLGISKIFVGPSAHAQSTVQSISSLLQIRFDSFVEVVSSGIPYRS